MDRVGKGRIPTSLTLNFSLRQRMVYYLFWSAYAGIINPEDFQNFFGASLNQKYGLEILLCRVLGFIKKIKGEYHLTERGAYWFHYIEQAYTTAYIDKMWNVSGKVAFPEKIILE